VAYVTVSDLGSRESFCQFVDPIAFAASSKVAVLQARSVMLRYFPVTPAEARITAYQRLAAFVLEQDEEKVNGHRIIPQIANYTPRINALVQYRLVPHGHVPHLHSEADSEDELGEDELEELWNGDLFPIDSVPPLPRLEDIVEPSLVEELFERVSVAADLEEGEIVTWWYDRETERVVPFAGDISEERPLMEIDID
jgi:hypothetical protein